MTVIASFITRKCIAFASDSFLTIPEADGTSTVVERQESKLFRVESLRGLLAYCGLAGYGGWQTRDWLRARAEEPRTTSAAEFARALAEELNDHLSRVPQRVRGVGVHFGAYELIEGRWIPELFWIRSWSDPPGRELLPEVVCTRETIGVASGSGRQSTDGEAGNRLRFMEWLGAENTLMFNNGDPALFNPVANGMGDAVSELARRGVLVDGLNWRTWASAVRRPVEVVSALVGDFALPGHRVIGGRIHDLVVSSEGRFDSTSGD